jgi:hypothetical protein
MTEGIYPAMLHQDRRCFRGTGTVWSRLARSLGLIRIPGARKFRNSSPNCSKPGFTILHVPPSGRLAVGPRTRVPKLVALEVRCEPSVETSEDRVIT